MRPKAAAAPLPALVARYLACDGSHGLLDARTRTQLLPLIVAAVGPERIEAEKKLLLLDILGKKRE